MMRNLTAVIALLIAALTFAATPVAQASDAPASSAPRWLPETVAAFGRMPVQDGGRIKPISTFAGFTLLAISGRRTTTNAAGDSISATEWLLDVLFAPERAKDYPVFLVENDAVLDAIGVPHAGKRKRDKYAWRDLEPHFDALIRAAQEHTRKDAKQRSTVEQQLVLLGNSAFHYRRLGAVFDFARERFEPPAGKAAEILGAGTKRFSDVFQKLGPLVDEARKVPGDPATYGADPLVRFLSGVLRTAQRSEALAIFPPPAAAAADRVWRTIADMTDAAMAPGAAAEALPAAIVDSERLVDAVADPEKFRVEMERLSNDVRDAAALRGEGRHVDLEVTYYGLDLIYRSLIVFLIGFLMCAVLWLRPNAKWLLRSTVATILLGNLMLTAAIVLRCIVRERPPVSTLYETILFIACVIVFVALIVEWITPRRIVLSLGAFLGALGMFLAMKLEEVERVDTMPSLVAVLDTNFWLATHVTSVTIGYAAGLLAGAIAHVYVIGRLLRWRTTDVAFYKSLARMVYGVLCFGLLFALVGTVLGGIWANDSWGRFWGWDPKENGALMIVLSQLAILHARMGGYLRDFGICMSAIAGSIIVAFSWWGVNQLGVGLHSYGFTQGISFALLCFYGIEAITLCLGAFAWFRDRIGVDAAAAAVARQTGPPALPTSMPGDGVQSPG